MYDEALMARVKERIAADPLQLNMWGWWGTTEGIDIELDTFCFARESDTCGTVACIAGWVLYEAGVRQLVIPRGLSSTQESGLIQAQAAARLGVTSKDTDDLFFASDWPAEFADAFRWAEEANDPEEAARIALARIEAWELEIKARFRTEPDEVGAALRGVFAAELQEVT